MMCLTEHAREFGVEQEHFILDGAGAPPTLLGIEELWRELARQFDGTLAHEGEQVVGVQFRSDCGVVDICNDACTHILEVAFPPLKSLETFRVLYERTWNAIRSVLKRVGFEIVLGGTLSKVRGDIQWVLPATSVRRSSRLSQLLDRPRAVNALFCREMPAYFAATQVSLTSSPENVCPYLKALYSFDFLVPLLFSTSCEFGEFRAHCVRPVVIEANLGGYVDLLNVPERIPADWDSYQKRRQQNRIRDYSAIAVREPNRVEFRSACSQPDVASVLSLIQLRQAIFCAALEGKYGQWDSRETFFAACQGQATPSQEALEILQPWLSCELAETVEAT